MSNEMINQIASFTNEQLFNNYCSLIAMNTENEILAEEYEDIRFGKKGEFSEIDIYDIIEQEKNPKDNSNLITINQKQKLAWVGNNEIPLSDYRSEKERRFALMRKRLYNQLKEESPWTPDIKD